MVARFALAGANEDEQRGLLTAEEVAGLDLSGVRLVVLSACETALGRQAGWQGVAGGAGIAARLLFLPRRQSLPCADSACAAPPRSAGRG